MDRKASTQLSIYRIDTSLFDGLISSENIVSNIVNEYNAKKKNSEIKNEQESGKEHEVYKEQGLKEVTILEGFSVKIFYAAKLKQPRWKRFFEPYLLENSQLLKAENKDASFASFLYNDNYIFAITGGQGNFLIQNYIDQNFGIDIISRLISQNSKVIKSLDERGLTGSILASRKYYRFNYKLTDEDEFGKLYKQVIASLDKDLLINSLGFNTNDIKKSVGCIAKSTLKFNKSIDLKFLAKLLKKISGVIDKQQPKFIMNKVVAISRRNVKHKPLINKLDSLLYEKIYEQFNSKALELEVDICHSEFEKFLEASFFKLFIEGKQNPVFEEKAEEIADMEIFFNAIEKQDGLNKDDKGEIIEFIKNLKIRSYDAEGALLTEGAFIKHITGEYTLNEEIYFIIDGDWYKIESDFITRMNDECKNVITKCLDNTILEETWNKEIIEDENAYNQLYFGKKDYIVLDKVVSENIELCDIIKHSDNKLHLIHVKQGFGNTMRDLTSQIAISARRLKEVKMTGDYKFIERYYKSLLDRQNSDSEYSKRLNKQTEGVSKAKFVGLFKNRAPVYCLAFIDNAKSDRSISEVEKFDSNIAKYSIIELNRLLKSMDIELKIIQIKES